MADNAELVGLEISAGVATLTMQAAPHNLVDKPLLDSLAHALEKSRREGVRAVVLRSKLRNFSAGAELALFEHQGARLKDFELLPYLDMLEAYPAPIIASVHGVALGGGFELALACDIIIASDSAKFGMVEVTLGLHPLMGGIQRVAARAGLARAKEMTLLGRRYDAATLERWGIINSVVAEAQLVDITRTMAEELAAGPTVAHIATKKLMAVYLNEGIASSDKAMAEIQKPIMQSEDLAAGLKAFHASGPGHAVFAGR